MAGETIKTEAICLDIRPWSRTSHVVNWLTPVGKVSTLVKGAVRPKSAFLGQYDLNYTCEIVYYARATGELHALRECEPINLREHLRADYRLLALAGYFRELALRLTPQGPEARSWYEGLDGVNGLGGLEGLDGSEKLVAKLLGFEMMTLHLLGLSPEIEAEEGHFFLRGERKIQISSAVVECLKHLPIPSNLIVMLDSARVIGVYYQFHVDVAAETRRSVLRILQTK